MDQGLDPVTLGTLWFFGALAVGGLAGWALGSFTKFETGLGAGLLLPGAVALWLAARFWLQWRAAPASPEAADLRGGAIAFFLFGTFPFSLGAFFLAKQSLPERAPMREEHAPRGWGPRRIAIVALNLMLVAGIVWPVFNAESVARGLMQGFGVIAAAILLHGVRGLFDPRASLVWCLGMLVLGANFASWVVALHLLIGQS